MKILHIAPISLLSTDEVEHLKIGGLSKSVSSLSIGQSKNGHEIGVISTRESSNPFSKNIYWTSLGSKSLLSILINNPFKKIYTDFGKPDLIHAHDIYEIKQLVIIIYAIFHDIKVYMSPRGTLSEVAMSYNKIKKQLYLSLIFNFIVTKLEGFVALNEGEKQSIKKYFPKKKIVIIGNGVDEQTEFLSKNKKIYDNKKEDKYINICFLGRFEIHIKGLDILLESFLSYVNSRKFSKIRLILIGEHSIKRYNSKEFINQIEKSLINAKSLAVIEPLYNEEKLKALASSDIFVHPSRTEGMPNGVLEAMSLGLPCLVSPETNMGPFIQEADCGWIVKNTIDSYIRIFEEIELMTKEQLLLKGANGLDYSKKHLSWKAVAKVNY